LALVVVLDGPAGAGKSTASKLLAARLGLRFMDTGAMYRAFTLRALKKGADLESPAALARIVDDGRLEMPIRDGKPRVILDGEDVSEAIRTPEVTKLIYKLAEEGGVRARLNVRQRDLARELGSMVAEGRDLGTVVFPDATVKLYLDASSEVRAKRRRAELGDKAPPLEQVKREIEERDRRDETRAVAPLKKADDAIVVDTSNLTLEQVVDRLEQVVRERAAKGGALSKR
jgi:cytidylate kinase